jgi:cytoskeleton protein RodZ
MTETSQSDGAVLASTAGGLLKAARQAAGMHLAVLSVNLKVPVRQLEALEADQYPFDQSPVFARSLAASVCRQLRVDPAPILALMPMSANYLASSAGERQVYTAPPNLGRMRCTASGVPGKTGWLAFGMLVSISGLIWLPNLTQWSWFESLRAPVPASESFVQAPTPLALVDNPDLTRAVESVPSQEPVPISAPEVQSSQSNLVGTQPELVFSAQNISWIEVRDAQKQLIWNGVLNLGDTKRLPLTLPVFVVVGRSDAVQLSVNGQPFNLKPHTQVNTARVEVKP